MHEREKLDEAQYFLSRMDGEQNEREMFRHDLSAFLAAARSVLQYARKEAESKQGSLGIRWYDTEVGSRKVVQFLRDERNNDVHEEPVRPSAHFTRSVRSSVPITTSLSAVVTDAHGNVKQTVTSDPAPPPTTTPQDANEDKVTYHFKGWAGPEDVLTLCREYIRHLDEVTSLGVQRGFITG